MVFRIFTLLISQLLSMNIPESDLPRIVIIGGGFAGINLAKSLSNKELQIVLLVTGLQLQGLIGR